MTSSPSTAAGGGPLRVQRDDRGVVTLTLDDAPRFNALGHEMLAALQQALDDVARDDSVRVVVLAAAGKATVCRRIGANAFPIPRPTIGPESKDSARDMGAAGRRDDAPFPMTAPHRGP